MKSKKGIKEVLVRFYMGVSLGLIVSGITLMAQTSFTEAKWWTLAIVGSVLYGISAAIEDEK